MFYNQAFGLLKSSIEDGSFEGEYDEAQEFFRRKRDFFKTIIQKELDNAIQNQLEENVFREVNLYIEEFKKELADNSSTQKLVDEARGLFGEIINAIMSKNKGLNKTKIINLLRTRGYNSDMKKSTNDLAKQEMQELFEEAKRSSNVQLRELFKTGLFQNLSQGQIKGYTNQNIITSLQNFLVRGLAWKARGEKHIHGSPARLAGYMKEQCLYKSMQKMIEQLNTDNIVVQEIGQFNKGNIGDVRMTIKIDQNLKNLLKNFEGFTIVEEDFVNFDVSSKLQYQTLNNKNTIDELLGLKISRTQSFVQNFYASRYPPPDLQDSWVLGVAFLSQKQNIIDVLGIDNIFYAVQDKVYYTDEFIQAFRDAKLYLTFTKEGEKLTKQIQLDRYKETEGKRLTK